MKTTSRIFRRYKAGYNVWLETNEDNGETDELADAINRMSAQIITMKVARTPAGHYIGDPRTAHMLCKKIGIAPEVLRGHKVCSIGFCEREQKWYGWSHRAIYGFGVGSHVKPGNCGYMPKDKEDFRLNCIRFWDDKGHDQTAAHETTEGGHSGVRTEWRYAETVPNKKIRGSISSVFTPYPEIFGRGKWTAKTLDDARQMACDFAEGVG